MTFDPSAVGTANIGVLSGNGNFTYNGTLNIAKDAPNTGTFNMPGGSCNYNFGGSGTLKGGAYNNLSLVNAAGSCVTGVVAVIVGGTKFFDGAWLSMGLMAVIVLASWRIRAHYATAAKELGLGLVGSEPVTDFFYVAATSRPQTVLIPVDKIDRAVLRTIAYARQISPNAVAVHVAAAREEGLELRRQWDDSMPDVPLVILQSPEGFLVEPIIAYLEVLDRSRPNQMVSVVLTEVIPKHFWERPLQTQLTQQLKKRLANRPNIALVHVPYHL